VHYPSLRILIFVGMLIQFSVQALMEYHFRKEKRLYILSLITAGLFLVSIIIYQAYSSDKNYLMKLDLLGGWFK